MNDALQATITSVIARAPDWMRQDLVSKDAIVRQRAEETLGAMIANAMNETGKG
jgi:hypothetical protein